MREALSSDEICDVDTLTCICPPEMPDMCPNDDVLCTNVMGDDDDHCGDCETACPATSVCNGGVCYSQCQRRSTISLWLTSFGLWCSLVTPYIGLTPRCAAWLLPAVQ